MDVKARHLSGRASILPCLVLYLPYPYLVFLVVFTFTGIILQPDYTKHEGPGFDKQIRLQAKR